MPKVPPPRRATAFRVADLFDTACLHCLLHHGRPGTLQPLRYRFELRVGTRRFHTTLPGQRCAECGQGGRGRAELDYVTERARQLADEGDRQPEAVRFVREQAGFTVAHLADLLGVSRQTVHRWEGGQTPIDMASFALLRLLLVEHAADSGTPLRDWLEQVQGLRRRPHRRFESKIKGRAPALERARRAAREKRNRA